MQTKKQSLVESLTNTAIGFGVSYVSTFLIFPMVGLNTSAKTNLVITCYFTVISIVRGYVIRRWFNKKKPNYVTYPNGEKFWAHCFNCEIEMPVIEKDGDAYCSNCGLIHKNSY